MPQFGIGGAVPPPTAVVETGRSTLTFHLGDCLHVLAALPPASVSVVVTSPPYNLGVRYRSYDDTLPRDLYLQWTEKWLSAVRAILAPEGSLFLNVGARPKDPWTALDIAQVARRHFVLQNTLHWIKSIVIEKEAAGLAADLERDLAVGHYKPINSDRFVNDCHEFIFHFTPEGHTPVERRAIGVEYQDASNIGRWQSGGSNRRCRGNAWFIPYETIQSRDQERPHPATFPPKLAEYCLRLHGLERVNMALDPFLGLGSSACAAARLGIEFIGIELDGHYLAEAVTRVKKEAGLGTPEPRRRVVRPRKRSSNEPGLF
jgi:site-specific DNA-methyltransferase (adenine-specific)